MAPCELCTTSRAQILRPKNKSRICGACFTSLFESEIAETITSNNLFQPGEKVAIGASGGKDSTVLASVLKTLNDRHKWGLELVLLSIDEGITGYRDHSLEAVKRNSEELGLPLKIVSYEELYGWSMDQVVEQIGKKNNCTYCGVFRRQALDRGAAMLGVGHVVTGHNADDVAETVLMNLLRGDLPRLSRATSIITSTPSATPSNTRTKNRNVEVGITNVKRSKPLMYAYEKEIVLYAHHKKLDYFSTECIYSPEAFRGSARTLIKNLERIRPESILDVVRSGVDMARLVQDGISGAARGRSGMPAAAAVEQEEGEGGCGNAKGDNDGGDMKLMEEKLREEEQVEGSGMETEIRLPSRTSNGQRHDRDVENKTTCSPQTLQDIQGQNHDRNEVTAIPVRTKQERRSNRKAGKDLPATKQRLGQCERCGYLSSQAVCKACVLLEGLNKARPRTSIEVGGSGG